jgi:acyl carrier protein
LTEPAAFQIVEQALRVTFKDPGLVINRSTTAEDIDGWDSLSHAVLMLRLEKNCNVRIPAAMASSFQNIGELVDRLVELTADSNVTGP